MDVSELLSRVEGATGPDRELDRDIGLAIGGWKHVGSGPYGMLDIGGDLYPDHPGSMYPALTESVDDALALVERLHGAEAGSLCYAFDLNYHCYAHVHMAYVAVLHFADGNPAVDRTVTAQAPTLPLAILAALLKARSLPQGETP